MSTNGETLKFRAAKLKGFTVYKICWTLKLPGNGVAMVSNFYILVTLPMVC